MRIPLETLFAVTIPGESEGFQAVFTEQAEAQAEADQANDRHVALLAQNPWAKQGVRPYKVMTLAAALYEIGEASYARGAEDGTGGW